MNKTLRHYEETSSISASPEEVFTYVDDHKRFSSHMNRSSWMMGGGKMKVSVDEEGGQKVGSHIRMSGTAFRMKIFLDEVVTRYEPPTTKTWETVGDVKLLVIGQYRMGIDIKNQSNGSNLHVFIDYDLPTKNTWLGTLFGEMYAKWCVSQMIRGANNHFSREAKDSICGMKVDLGTTKFKSTYQGKIYGFCSSGCKASFDENPVEYADANC